MLTRGQNLLTFEVENPLGAGGMGEVYRARDTSLNREVALKVLPAVGAEVETIRRRFNREAQTLAALDHPHVARIYGYHETEGVCFLSLEFVPGEDLSQRLLRGALAVDEAIAICTKIAAGLEAAHRAGIVHRDLKPANVRITPQGDVKILDFGLATLATPSRPEVAEQGVDRSTTITKEGTILGTPAYMSPEQARGLPTDHRTDIWSFGCVLYECLTGKRAFPGQTVADVIAAVLKFDPDWDALPASTSRPLLALLRSCLEKAADRRPEDLDAARLQLSFLAGDGASSTVSIALTRAQRAYESHDWQSAFDLLEGADHDGQLEPEGLELLAECARWIGRNEAVIDPFERAHAAHVAGGDRRAAVRTALALCLANADAGRRALTKAWLERADELIARLSEGPEHAWHAWFHSRACGEQGDLGGQEQHARRALELSRRFADRNVEALAMIDLSHVAATQGENAAALDWIKRATSLALGGEIDIFATGMVFCNAIWACRCRGEWQRAQEWTESATRWVSRQQVEYFPGMCRVHRAEVLRIRGDLAAAERESDAATRQVTQTMPAYATFPWSELGEVRRRRGNLSGAMEAFQQAISLGWDPQPGLALLLLQQGDAKSAHRAIERAFCDPRPTMLREDRANLLTARATIAIAAGQTTVAQQAVEELETMASRNASAWDNAAAAHSRGMVELTAGDAPTAVEHLLRGRRLWAELETPYELATTAVLLGRALHADGDPTQARLELQAARDVFERIGAQFDCERTEQILEGLDGNAAPQISPAPRQRSPSQASLRRQGDTWSFDFQGRTVRLRSTRGMEYLAMLLDQPGVQCWAIDLAGSGGTADRGDAGEVLDSTARQTYRRRAEELREELAEIDAGSDAAQRIRTELDVIARELAAAVGLGGRPRRAGSAAERARQTVTKGIRAAIRKIAANDAELGRYLDVTIRTGTACCFEPQLREPVEWRVEP